VTKIALSIVHHANQLVITNGYTHRDGISRVCAGYLDVLELHREYGVPVSLHLSGTLVEAMLWHEPACLDRIRQLAGSELCGLLGGTYSEPIMPVLSDAMNRRQLVTMREILAEQFPAVAHTVSTAWLPERVWAPQLLDVLADPDLPHGPYHRILVDDRLIAPSTVDDEAGPFHWARQGRLPAYHPDMIDLDALRPRTVVAGGRRLTMVPICSYLRYLFPPRTGEQWEFLGRLLADLAARSTPDDPVLLVYADDMERAGGVGGWEPAITEYERLLAWLAANDDVELVELDSWLDRHRFAERGPVPAGSYYELEVAWGAGADYTGWSDDPQWLPYAESLRAVEADIGAAWRRLSRDAGARDLLTLAYRLLMLGQHETAWRDPVYGCLDGSQRHLAPWVRATAAHASLARPLVAAAAWAADGGCSPMAEWTDIDGDGETELVLADDRMWCVVSPRHGARLTLMCHRDADGCPVVVGNPADHWNYQEELHRFMDVPAAHPGALADRDHPHEQWSARLAMCRPDAVVVDLYRPGAAEWSRRYALLAGIPGLLVHLRGSEPVGTIDNLLTPDYLAALTRGGTGTLFRGGRHVGWCHENRSSWVAFDPWQAHASSGAYTEAAHGHLASVCVLGEQAELIIGAGPVDDRQIAAWLARARTLLCDEPDPVDSGLIKPTALAGESL
jgi:hypothetical protein